jgi:hypothetical protein
MAFCTPRSCRVVESVLPVFFLSPLPPVSSLRRRPSLVSVLVLRHPPVPSYSHSFIYTFTHSFDPSGLGSRYTLVSKAGPVFAPPLRPPPPPTSDQQRPCTVRVSLRNAGASPGFFLQHRLSAGAARVCPDYSTSTRAHTLWFVPCTANKQTPNPPLALRFLPPPPPPPSALRHHRRQLV